MFSVCRLTSDRKDRHTYMDFVGRTRATRRGTRPFTGLLPLRRLVRALLCHPALLGRCSIPPKLRVPIEARVVDDMMLTLKYASLADYTSSRQARPLTVFVGVMCPSALRLSSLSHHCGRRVYAKGVLLLQQGLLNRTWWYWTLVELLHCDSTSG